MCWVQPGDRTGALPQLSWFCVASTVLPLQSMRRSHIGFTGFSTLMTLHPRSSCISCSLPCPGVTATTRSVTGICIIPSVKSATSLYVLLSFICGWYLLPVIQIPPNSSGLIEYRAHPFWGQKYCPLHEKDSTPRCCSCERVEARDARFVSLDDGRKLCLECLDSAVMDTHECQHLYHEILDFYEGMNMKISQSIPMLLVERQALNEAREHERDGYHHLPETRGLCLSEEQTVSTVYRKPKASRSNPVGSMRKESLRLRRQCEVTAILVLYGLPRLLTGSILAHELMHAWLRLNGYPHQLNPAVEEGICQVMAHTWLESQIGSSGGSSSSSSGGKQKPKSINNDRFQEFFLHQIAMDSSPAYGDGFRAGHQSVVQFGLSRTLEHIKLTGSFPV
ncbi:protein DA1-related 1 isoform X2 [Selaginella moellendorffii]|uniref:protein DA1-related 1 isoform X2 n=1 Tax=Selaginella moellendorffii TaxID=88036 RepID=UPI000D1CA470|nr:protein DA1-related 1 isoform X2 [Selaginella moellendorffii]|eukprot:XP_024520541.1 protein DA1-related 1 isoform X2 [Selaginella moellendorffii]